MTLEESHYKTLPLATDIPCNGSVGHLRKQHYSGAY